MGQQASTVIARWRSAAAHKRIDLRPLHQTDRRSTYLITEQQRSTMKCFPLEQLKRKNQQTQAFITHQNHYTQMATTYDYVQRAERRVCNALLAKGLEVKIYYLVS